MSDEAQVAVRFCLDPQVQLQPAVHPVYPSVMLAESLDVASEQRSTTQSPVGLATVRRPISQELVFAAFGLGSYR
jgi:hypothetical protein